MFQLSIAWSIGFWLALTLGGIWAAAAYFLSALLVVVFWIGSTEKDAVVVRSADRAHRVRD
jgi:hypothetical protein